jgi:hypothetical protein
LQFKGDYLLIFPEAHKINSLANRVARSFMAGKKTSIGCFDEFPSGITFCCSFYAFDDFIG